MYSCNSSQHFLLANHIQLTPWIPNLVKPISQLSNPVKEQPSSHENKTIEKKEPKPETSGFVWVCRQKVTTNIRPKTHNNYGLPQVCRLGLAVGASDDDDDDG